MRENAGRRTDSGSEVGSRKRKGQEPGVITARSLNQLAAPAVDALQSCALQHPVACEAIPVPAEAQGDMQATSGFQSKRQTSATVKLATYEAAKRMLRRESLDPSTYEACLALITRELGL